MSAPQPLRNKVIVCRLRDEQTLESGLIVKGLLDTNLPRFIVEAVGPDVTMVKVGEIVFCDMQKIKSVPYDELDTWIVEEENILGVLDA